MRKIAWLVLFTSTSLFAQKTILKGTLLDKNTEEPVVYASISFLKIKKGISSTENGTFQLEINQKDLNRKLHISCLNYQDTIVLASDLQNKILLLTPKSYELNEITLSKKLNMELEVDKYKRKDIKTSFGSSKGNPWIVTKFFAYKDVYEETPYIKDITVYFGSLLMRKKGKFRLRIYAVDTVNKRPSEDILTDNLVVSMKKINGKIKVDMSSYDIEIPKEGLYIGIERLEIPYNFNEYTYTMEGSKKKHKAISIAPSIGAVFTKDTTYMFQSGTWRKFYFPGKKYYDGNNIEPAISVTLSN